MSNRYDVAAKALSLSSLYQDQGKYIPLCMSKCVHLSFFLFSDKSIRHILILGPENVNFFVLNSAELEICPANKSQITNNCKFHAKHS